MPNETGREKRTGPPPIPLSMEEVMEGYSPEDHTGGQYDIGGGFMALPAPTKESEVSYIIFKPAPKDHGYDIGKGGRLYDGLNDTSASSEFIITRAAWVKTRYLESLQQKHANHRVIGALKPDGINVGKGEIKKITE